ncbi:MAG: twin-arginine translocation signal domain-containing protein [Chloroflexi bacterium]|nr:twin-arginine translocation signal domain-containing protein [Chloroflexota bacterium]
MKQNLSRRSFLKGTGLVAGATLVGYESLFGISTAFARDAAKQSGTPDDDLQTVINLAATAELFASTHYLAAINSAASGDLALDKDQVDYLKTAFLAERDHYDLLVSLGAVPVVTQFYVPDGLFTDVAMFSNITEVAEEAFVAAYLAAARIFTELGQPAFAVTAAQISAVEAEHRALVRQIGKRLANNVSYEKAKFNNVSDAVPVLQPFLDGKSDGFVGPVDPPTDAQVQEIRDQAAALGYMATTPYAAMASSSASSSSSVVTVTAFNQAVNIRQEPSTSSGVVGTILAKAQASIDGQRTVDGIIWWHVATGGWIRSDTVSEGDGASNLPTM